METRKPAPAKAQNATCDPLALWSTVLDLPRQQSVAATHAACALFGGFEAMRKIQEKAAHAALPKAQLQDRQDPRPPRAPNLPIFSAG